MWFFYLCDCTFKYAKHALKTISFADLMENPHINCPMPTLSIFQVPNYLKQPADKKRLQFPELSRKV